MKKTEPWRIVLGVISIAFIVYMWIKKDIASSVVNLPREQLLSLVVTGAGVSLLKVLALAAVIFLLKAILGNVFNRDE